MPGAQSIGIQIMQPRPDTPRVVSHVKKHSREYRSGQQGDGRQYDSKHRRWSNPEQGHMEQSENQSDSDDQGHRAKTLT
jgi:hypothetical protein